ncbi:hypothetical protein L208DRAFT_1415159, partial [Tricholoma matsutake]
YYVVAAVNNEVSKKTMPVKSTVPSWDNTLYFEGCGMSKLKLKVFAVWKFGPDKVIGELEEKIETLLALDNNGAVDCKLCKGLKDISAGIQFVIQEVVGGLVSGAFIVAIHGLYGHPMKSWTAANDMLWLCDLLPEKIPRRDQLADESVYAIAQKLLADLATDWDGSNTQQWSIIFVVHSLGGIVLKNALIHADRNEYAPYKAVECSTYGILFLGTPHQGSAAVDLAALILQILSIGFDTSDSILCDLALHGKALQQQQDQYNQISLRYATKCYYEMYPTKLPLGKRMKVGGISVLF